MPASEKVHLHDVETRSAAIDNPVKVGDLQIEDVDEIRMELPAPKGRDGLLPPGMTDTASWRASIRSTSTGAGTPARPTAPRSPACGKVFECSACKPAAAHLCFGGLAGCQMLLRHLTAPAGQPGENLQDDKAHLSVKSAEARHSGGGCKIGLVRQSMFSVSIG